MAMYELVLNLSFMLTPCVFVAAIVVSDMIDKLSPNIAPPIIVPTIRGIVSGVLFANPTPIGSIAPNVPIEVPMARDMNDDIMNIPGNRNHVGMIVSPRFTVESTPPMLFDTSANAPAIR